LVLFSKWLKDRLEHEKTTTKINDECVADIKDCEFVGNLRWDHLVKELGENHYMEVVGICDEISEIFTKTIAFDIFQNPIFIFVNTPHFSSL